MYRKLTVPEALNLTHEDYNKLSDDVYFVGKNMILKLNVSLYTTTPDGKRYLYHKEYGYYDQKIKENTFSLKRSFDYYLSLENINATDTGVKEFIRIGYPELLLLKTKLKIVYEWFNEERFFDLYRYTKDQKLSLPRKPPKIVLNEFPQSKYIELTPVVINDQHPGVRLYLNSDENYADIYLSKFMGFYQVITDFNLYMAAQNLLNYFGRPDYGTNAYIMQTNDLKVTEEEKSIKAPLNRKIKEKSSHSAFEDLM